METFVRVVDVGSFSGAAKLLRVGQPAVSKAVAQLEKRLGVRLLLRSSHGLKPTEAGRSFYQRARRSIEEADEAELAARGEGTALSGRLRISAPVAFTCLHVIPQLPAFFAEHPKLDVELVLDDRNIDLIEAGIDVGFRFGELGDSSLTARKIAKRPRRVIGTPAYFKAMGVPQTPADLLKHHAVVFDQLGGGIDWTFRRGEVETSLRVNGHVSVTVAEGVRQAVFSGLGLVIASEWMFEPELRSGVVTSVLHDWVLPAIDLWAVFPSGRQASAKSRAFVHFVEKRLTGPLKEQEFASARASRKRR
jgi:DNA-binding transcriptional LysR family regulator